MSDRLMYAASQFISMAFLVRRVGAWARLPTMSAEDGSCCSAVTAGLSARSRRC